MSIRRSGKRLSLFGFAGAVAALALLASACGGAGASGDGSGSGVSGKIAISGSSTVLPITTRVAEKFQQTNPDVSVSVDGPGTTDGFALFCAGNTQISDASRPIDPAEEVPLCKKNGVDFVELRIGIDGITVMTSPENNSVECLDFKDLYALIGPESQGFAKWSDANQLGEEIGAGHTPYPDVPLTIVGPGQESGTWGSFIDFVVKPIAEERSLPDDKVETTRTDYQSSANDNVIIQGIEGSPDSLGWVGFAYYEENAANVRAIPLAGDDGKCITPSTSTIKSRTYPMSRDLFIYVNAEQAKSNKALDEFVNFYLSKQGLSSVSEVGYVDQPSSVLSETQQTWKNRTTGTQQ